MTHRFPAILLRELHGFPVHSIIDVMVGGEDFNGRWLVLTPVELAGKWLVPLLDADAAITTREASVALTCKRGKAVSDGNVRRYVSNGNLKHSGMRDKNIFLSRDEVWRFEFPLPGNPKWRAEKLRRLEEANG